MFVLSRIKALLLQPLQRRIDEIRTSRRFPNLTRGSGCWIAPTCSVLGSVTLGRTIAIGPETLLYNAKIGDYTYLGSRCQVAFAEIGKFCSIAPEVYVGLGSHPLTPFVSTHPAFVLHRPEQGWSFADRDYHLEYAPTCIGNDVWLGLRAAIKDGVTIHDGAIVAAGAVVVDDVPPYAIVGGVPAKVIRYRFRREIIEFLLSLKWWDRSEEWLGENWKNFHDISEFMHKFEAAQLGSRRRSARM